MITSVSFVGRWRLKLTFSAIDIGLGALLHGCISICCPNSNPQSPTPTPTPPCPCNPTPNRTRLLHLFVYLAGIVFQFQGSASVRPSVHLSVCLSVCPSVWCALTPDCLLWFAGVVAAGKHHKQAVANGNLIRKKFAAQSA